MREVFHSHQDFLQNIAIVLLALTAVLLFAQTQLYTLGASAGASYLDYLLDSDDPQAAGSPADLLSGLPAPVRIAVTGVFEGRYGNTALTTGDEAFEPLGSLFRETLGSAQPFEQCSPQEFLQALTNRSVYCDFLNPLPLSVAAGLSAASWEEDGILVRYLAAAAGDSGTVTLYVWDGGESCLHCGTAVSEDELDRIINRYEFNGAMFAFDAGGLSSLSPCSLLPADVTSLPSLTASVSLPGMETLLSSLGFYPRTNSRYPEADGTEVITEGNRSLRVGADGVIRYRDGGENTLSISAAGESPTIPEAAAGIWTLLNSLLSPYSGEAALYLESMSQTESSTTLTFGLQAGGVPIRSADGSPAAQATLSGKSVTALSLRYRQYTAGQSTPLLPLRQTLGIASALPGADLSIGYADNGGSEITAQWLAD